MIKKVIIYGFVVLMAIIASALIVRAGDITSGNNRMKVEVNGATIYFDTYTSVSALEGKGNAYALNRGRIIVDGEADITVNDGEFYPTVRVDGVVEINNFNNESVKVIKGRAELHFQAGSISLEECDYWRMDNSEIKRNCWFWDEFERYVNDQKKYEEVNSVIESRTATYIVIRVYDPYWGGYCRIRYYCTWPCYDYDWYWTWGYGRYCNFNGCYWRPQYHFWIRHYWSEKHGYFEVYRNYHLGYHNTFPYRPNSVKKVDAVIEKNRIDQRDYPNDYPKKPMRNYGSVWHVWPDKNKNQKFDHQFKKKVETHQNPSESPKKLKYYKNYKKSDSSSRSSSSPRRSNSSSRKSAPKSTRRQR